jgi:hypothetical protein
VNREGALQPGPWLKSPGWRAGSFLIGLTALVMFVDWVTGDLFDVGWWGRPMLVVLLGFVLSWPYGWAWVHGNAPAPPRPAVIVPQAAVQQGEGGNTYVVVGPHAEARRPGLWRKARDLGALAWFFYTIFWRWPVTIGDAILTFVWRGLNRLFGFNGGPRRDHTQGHIDYPEDLPPPDQEQF